MSTIRSVFPVLFILIFSSWSSVVVASDEGSEESLSITSNEFISESQWSQLFSVSESVYDVKNFSGLIYSPFGDFDPLYDPIPLGPENLYDLSAIHRTGLVIIQSKSVDMTGLMQLLYSHDLPIIDTLPDSALVVRLPTDDNLGTISL